MGFIEESELDPEGTSTSVSTQGNAISGSFINESELDDPYPNAPLYAKGASSLLRGISNFGDLFDLTTRINPLGTKSAYEKISGHADPQAVPSHVGSDIRNFFDTQTNLPNSTEMAKHELIGKLDYAPSMMIGGGNLLAGGFTKAALNPTNLVSTGGNLAKLLALIGVTGTGGYVGEKVAETIDPSYGPYGELVGAIAAPGTAALAINKTKNLVEALPDAAQALRRSALGATPGDFVRSIKNKGIANLGTEDVGSKLAQSLENIAQSGAMKGAKTPQDLLNVTGSKIEELSDSLIPILKPADDILAAKGVAATPKWTEAQKFVDMADATERPALQKMLDESLSIYEGELASMRANGQGSLTSMQNLKKSLYKKAYTEEGKARKILANPIAADLRRTIENVTGAIHPENAGTVKSINSKTADFLDYRRIAERQVGKEEGKNIGSKIANFFHTTGGVGAPMMTGAGIGAGFGGAPGAVLGGAVGIGTGLALKRAGTPSGQIGISKALDKAHTIADFFTSKIPQMPGFGQIAKGAGLATTTSTAEDFNSTIEDKQNSTSSGPETPRVLGARRSSNADTFDSVFSKPQEQGNDNMLPDKSFDDPRQQAAWHEIQKDPYLTTLAEVESSGNPAAKNPHSSASGLFQLIDSTSHNLGVKDRYNVADSLEGVKQLTDAHRAVFGDNVERLYAAHYLGQGVLQKVLDGKTDSLTEQQKKQVAYLISKGGPLERFMQQYAKNTQNDLNTGEA